MHAKRGVINISTPPSESNKEFSKENHFLKKYTLTTLTLKNLRGVKMTLVFWNNSRKKRDFSTKFKPFLNYDTRQ